MRHDGRANNELRPISFERDFTQMAHGSILTSFGKTKILCTASIEERVPNWLRNKDQGWVTAEYSLLPGSSKTRIRREADLGRQSGRTLEIQRLIARSLRAVCNLEALGERQLTLDCDVLQADGGTRTAAISGAFLAMHDACQRLILERKLSLNPLFSSVAAVSVGIVNGEPVLDLDYEEDFRAGTDMNVAMNAEGKFLEVQGTAEGNAFSQDELDQMLTLAKHGIDDIMKIQKTLLETPLQKRS